MASESVSNIIPDIIVSESMPPRAVMIVGRPSAIILAPGQLEPTDDQLIEAYRGQIQLITNIGE